MKPVTIYRLTSPSGKSYIGQTRDPLRRMQGHARPSGCLAIRAAVEKYGFGAFRVETLLVVPEVLANYVEARLIRSCRTLAPDGYNLRAHASVSKVSDETRARMSEAARARWTPESRAAFHPKHSDEARARMSDLAKERWSDPQFKAKMRAIIGPLATAPEARAKRAKKMAVWYASPESTKVLSKNSRVLWQDAEWKAAQLASHRTPEFRARMSELMRARQASWKAARVAKEAA